MAQGYEAADGIGAMLSGTPPVLALTAVGAGVELVADAGVPAIRSKSVALTEYAIAVADVRLGITIGSPRDASRRGSHVALVHPGARELCRKLIDGGVIVDFRPPDTIRLGLSPLTTSFADVWDGLERLRGLLA
jgi:kynureninase